MKRNIFILATIIASTTLYGQTHLDAYRFSKNDLSGTARSVSMGGAFGALGGDLGGVAINPAGISVYKSSEMVATINVQNANTESSFKNGLDFKDKKSKFAFSNLGYIASVSIDNENISKINFGFSYNRLKTFDSKSRMGGGTQDFSLTNYIASKSYGVSLNDLESSIDRNGDFNQSTPSWLSALAYQTFLIGPTGMKEKNNIYSSFLPDNQSVTPYMELEEKGAIDRYDFTVGAAISDKFSAGLTLSVTDIDYKMDSYYDEGFNKNNYFYLQNQLNTEGSGVQLNLGVIYKPVNALRLGVSYQSRTWYSMTDHFSANIKHDLGALIKDPQYKPRNISTGVSYVDYNMHTPDRWTFSIAGIIGKTAIISADYELTNYKNMKLADQNAPQWEVDQKYLIDQDFRSAGILRLGAEVRFTPQFSGRIGYMWQQSGLKSNVKSGDSLIPTTQTGIGEQMPIAGTITHFVIDGDTNYFTYGLGYRFSKTFYTDVAFVAKSQNTDLYPFGRIYNVPVSATEVTNFDKVNPAKLKTTTFSGLLTMGFKF